MIGEDRYNETDLLYLGDDRLLAASRARGGEGTVIFASDDCGQTWTSHGSASLALQMQGFTQVYQRHIDRGKHHLVALTHVANKMLHIVFSVLKNNRPYTPILN